MFRTMAGIGAATLVALAGCKSDGNPTVTSEPRPAPAATPAPQPTQAVSTGQVVIKGSQFTVDGKPFSKGDAFAVGHYVTATAPVEIKTTTSKVIIDIAGKPRKDSLPLVSFRLRTTQGKYQDFAIAERPIDGPQRLEEPLALPPGHYSATLNYNSDTVGQMRPGIELRQITFE